MRFVLSILLCLFLSVSAYAEVETLPEEAVGYWAPLSKTATGVGIHIHANGTIERITHADHTSFETLHYRYASSVSDHKIYYIVFNSASSSALHEVWQIYMASDDSNQWYKDLDKVLLISKRTCAIQKGATDLRAECKFKPDPYQEQEIYAYSRYIPEMTDLTVLPKEFLGYWRPLSKTMGETGISIGANKKIEFLLNGKSRTRALLYRPVFSLKKGHPAYIVTKDMNQNPAHIKFWQLQVKQEENSQVLTVIDLSCKMADDDFANFSQQKLKEIILFKKCGNGGLPYEYGAGMDAFVR